MDVDIRFRILNYGCDLLSQQLRMSTSDLYFLVANVNIRFKHFE